MALPLNIASVRVYPEESLPFDCDHEMSLHNLRYTCGADMIEQHTLWQHSVSDLDLHLVAFMDQEGRLNDRPINVSASTVVGPFIVALSVNANGKERYIPYDMLIDHDDLDACLENLQFCDRRRALMPLDVSPERIDAIVKHLCSGN